MRPSRRREPQKTAPRRPSGKSGPCRRSICLASYKAFSHRSPSLGGKIKVYIAIDAHRLGPIYLTVFLCAVSCGKVLQFCIIIRLQSYRSSFFQSARHTSSCLSFCTELRHHHLASTTKQKNVRPEFTVNGNAWAGSPASRQIVQRETHSRDLAEHAICKLGSAIFDGRTLAWLR
jgi:hypothetical protein